MNDKLLISASNDSTIKVFDISQGKSIKTFENHSSKVLCLSTYQHYLASGSKDKTIKIFNLKNLSFLHTLEAHTHKVNSVKFSNSGKFLCSGSEDYTAIIWNI